MGAAWRRRWRRCCGAGRSDEVEAEVRERHDRIPLKLSVIIWLILWPVLLAGGGQVKKRRWSSWRSDDVSWFKIVNR